MENGDSFSSSSGNNERWLMLMFVLVSIVEEDEFGWFRSLLRVELVLR